MNNCPHLRQSFPGTPVNKCLDCGVTMPTSSTDIVSEARELLANIPAWKLTAVEWGNEMRIGYYEHGSRFTIAKVHTFEGPTIDKPMADLFARAPELIKALCDEVERLRENLNDPCLAAGYHMCGGVHDLSRLTEKE